MHLHQPINQNAAHSTIYIMIIAIQVSVIPTVYYSTLEVNLANELNHKDVRMNIIRSN